ncbi:aspartate aminotransferase, partial [Pasteurellaceae bacterium 15-036681]
MKEKTKVQQTYEWIEDKIKQGIYLPRHKIPSIRYLSNKLSVSTFTVSSAYDQLVSTGLIRSVAGAGYFVCEPTTKTEAFDVSSALINDVLDTGWLMTHLFGELPINKASGSGLLPNEWLLDSEVIANAVRKVTKEDMSFIYSYGHIQGYYPLREMFAKQLDQLGVSINPSLVITMPGVSSAIQTIIKTVTNAGDYVVVDDPSWFWLLGCLHQLDIKILTVKRNSDGPDINQLEHIFSEYKPKLYITNSILNNPTSYNISSSIMY